MIDNQFSARERDVIALLLQGNSNKEIALALDIANRTVEFHLGNIYAKLGVTSRTEAVIKLSDYLWESTGKVDTVNQGNPQLKKSDIRGILPKVFYHTYRSRRRPMKTFVRITILLLLAILIIIVIWGAFMLIRQSINPPAISMISVFSI
jgi:DNA-binding CsgD family transcriptional regulator